MSGDQLKHLPVVTVSGDSLGQVQGIEFDPEAHVIVAYLVAPSRLVRPLQRATLRIASSQVRSITPERMVVDDGLKRERASGGRERLPKSMASAISTRG